MVAGLKKQNKALSAGGRLPKRKRGKRLSHSLNSSFLQIHQARVKKAGQEGPSRTIFNTFSKTARNLPNTSQTNLLIISAIFILIIHLPVKQPQTMNSSQVFKFRYLK